MTRPREKMKCASPDKGGVPSLSLPRNRLKKISFISSSCGAHELKWRKRYLTIHYLAEARIRLHKENSKFTPKRPILQLGSWPTLGPRRKPRHTNNLQKQQVPVCRAKINADARAVNLVCLCFVASPSSETHTHAARMRRSWSKRTWLRATQLGPLLQTKTVLRRIPVATKKRCGHYVSLPLNLPPLQRPRGTCALGGGETV